MNNTHMAKHNLISAALRRVDFKRHMVIALMYIWVGSETTIWNLLRSVWVLGIPTSPNNKQSTLYSVCFKKDSVTDMACQRNMDSKTSEKIIFTKNPTDKFLWNCKSDEYKNPNWAINLSVDLLGLIKWSGRSTNRWSGFLCTLIGYCFIGLLEFTAGPIYSETHWCSAIGTVPCNQGCQHRIYLKPMSIDGGQVDHLHYCLWPHNSSHYRCKEFRTDYLQFRLPQVSWNRFQITPRNLKYIWFGVATPRGCPSLHRP